jgi:hypothetical protein
MVQMAVRMLKVRRTHLDGDDYLGRKVAPGQVAELRLDRFPPEVVLHDRRIGFVSAAQRPALERFARDHAIPLRDRVDVWALLTEPFLDTAHDEAQKEATLVVLEGSGFTRAEVAAVREYLGFPMVALAVATWEWAHFGLWDVLQAHSLLLGRRKDHAGYLPRSGSAVELRRWAEAIANRAELRAPAGDR